MPPPSTRSNSSMPDGTRGSSPESIASKGFGLEGLEGSVSCSGRPLPGGGATSCRSSTRLFHSPQSGQRPSHLELSKPQAWQAKTVRTLVMGRRSESRVDAGALGRPLAGASVMRPAAPLEVLEARELLDEGELAAAGGAVPLLADDDLRDAPVLVRGLVLLLAVDEHHDVRILFDGAAFAQVRQLRAAVGAGLGGAGELGERDHRHPELLGQALHRAADRRHLLLAVLDAPGRGHELQVVHDDEAEAVLGLEAPALGPHLERRDGGRVVDEELRLREVGVGLGEPRPVLLVELAGAQPVRVDRGRRRRAGAARAAPSTSRARTAPPSPPPASPRAGRC